MQRIQEEACGLEDAELEDLLFEQEEGGLGGADDSSDDEAASTTSGPGAAEQADGVARGSLGSSTLNNEAATAGAGQEATGPAAPLPMRAGFTRPPQPSQAHTRMGTSVPISITRSTNNMGVGKWGRQEEGAGADGVQTATFIPPHQLSQRDSEFLFSFTGASPTTTAKRERLKVRNAILARTGFLETPAAPAMASASGAERTPARMVSGGLSQALGSYAGGGL